MFAMKQSYSTTMIWFDQFEHFILAIFSHLYIISIYRQRFYSKEEKRYD